MKNCIVYHGHGGVTVGSEMSGGIRNLHVSNCTFIGTDAGLIHPEKQLDIEKEVGKDLVKVEK